MKPIVVLLSPQMGENIGAIARAMSNFGLDELRVVTPRDGWPNPKAAAMAANGEDIIDNAVVYNSFSEAICDLNYVFATGASKRDLPQNVYSPNKAAQKIAALKSNSQKIGIVFGRESTGMHNSEIALCQAMISIPCAQTNNSCNIAQAGAIIFYEVFQSNYLPPEIKPSENLATQKQLIWLCDYVYDNLQSRNFFPTKERAAMAKQNLASVFATANLNYSQAQLLTGIFRFILANNAHFYLEKK
jgi:tRNA/rRNA methyltransferase